MLYVQICAPHLEASFFKPMVSSGHTCFTYLLPQHGDETKCNERPKITLFVVFNRSQHPEVMMMFCAAAVEWNCVLGG